MSRDLWLNDAMILSDYFPPECAYKREASMWSAKVRIHRIAVHLLLLN